jgi:hypothetical protein
VTIKVGAAAEVYAAAPVWAYDAPAPFFKVVVLVSFLPPFSFFAILFLLCEVEMPPT